MSKLFVILCEGDHDKLFTYEILKKKSINARCYSQKKLTELRVKGGETTIIRDFSKTYRSKQLSRNERAIIKEEGNVNNAEDIFIELLKSGDQPCDIFLLIDQDKKNIKKLSKKIHAEIGKNLIKITDYCYKINDNKKVFFVPNSLEAEVQKFSNKKIDNIRDKQKKLSIFRAFIDLNIPWVSEYGQMFNN